MNVAGACGETAGRSTADHIDVSRTWSEPTVIQVVAVARFAGWIIAASC